MKPTRLEDLRALEAYLRQSAALQIYGLGDLDERFRPRTEWYGTQEAGAVTAAVLLYRGPSGTTLLALCPESQAPALRAVLAELELPERFYAHLSPGLVDAVAQRRVLHAHGRHLKMSLADPSAIERAEVSRALPLGPGDADELRTFYAESYPGNWFDPWMLETGQYFGVRDGATLAAVAGVHVYSPSYRVAALGNIATRPSSRGRGLASIAVAAACRSLARTVDLIGLNVHAENTAAIRLYESLGFVPIAEYLELDAG